MFRETLAFVMAGSLLVAGCGEREAEQPAPADGETAMDVAADAADQTAQGAMELRDQAHQEFTSRLNTLDRQFSDLESWIERVGDATPEEARNAAADIERRLEDARAQLAELRDASADAWEQVRNELNDATGQIEQSIQDAMKTVRDAAPSIPGMRN